MSIIIPFGERAKARRLQRKADQTYAEIQHMREMVEVDPSLRRDHDWTEQLNNLTRRFRIRQSRADRARAAIDLKDKMRAASLEVKKRRKDPSA